MFELFKKRLCGGNTKLFELWTLWLLNTHTCWGHYTNSGFNKNGIPTLGIMRHFKKSQHFKGKINNLTKYCVAFILICRVFLELQ